MRKALKAGAGVLAVAVALVPLSACGDDGSSGGGGASGEFGTGLKLGKVIRSSPVRASVGPWYVWNAADCKFEVTNDHPAEYKADIRKVDGGEAKIGYMHYGNVDPFGVSNSKSVEAVADEAGMPLDVYNLKYPSRTEPMAAANQAVVKGDKGVLQANLDPTILPQFFKILEGDGCIPSVQLYIPIDGHPSMGAHWPDVGTEYGDYIAEEAKARGWKPQDTALVNCIGRDEGPSVNVLFEEIPKALAAGGFDIPKENVTDLQCEVKEAQSGKKRVTDWFTSHPDFKHVAFTAVDSPRMQPMIQAVRAEDIAKEDTILVDAAHDPSSAASVRKGEQDLSVHFYGERYGDWLIPMIQDLMAGNPVPKIVGTEIVRVTKDNADEFFPEE